MVAILLTPLSKRNELKVSIQVIGSYETSSHQQRTRPSLSDVDSIDVTAKKCLAIAFYVLLSTNIVRFLCVPFRNRLATSS